MRAPAVSFANKLWAVALAALLTIVLVPVSALAEGEGETADASTEKPQEVSAEQVDEGSGSNPAASPAEGGTLASVLVGTPTTFINSDVALDGEPVIGSFTVDGLTFAVTEGSDVELVGVSSDWQQVASSQEGDGSPVAPMLASGTDGIAGDGSTLALPESITYNGTDYAVVSIGAYAFYLSGITAVELPATVTDVDERAFRSSDVASVAVAEGNPTYSSFDGALYSADRSSLLLIPEGKQGTVLLPKTAESAAPSVFSHCPLVTQVSVEEGSAAFASENGLLYSPDLTTLLRVPAGATDIVIRDGCTTIAAGAMEACASLATITAPASVTSVSPDVFTSVPTVSLPAVAVVADDPGASTGATEGPSEQASSIPASGMATTQLTALVALSSTADDLPEVDPSAITVSLPEGADAGLWEAQGFHIESLAIATTQSANTSRAVTPPNTHAVAQWEAKLYFQSNELVYGLHSGGEAANMVPGTSSQLADNQDGWWRGNIGDVVPVTVTVQYSDSKGWYLRRTGSQSATFERWTARKATSLSLTETGPALPVGTDVTGKTVYVRTDNVVLWDANGGTCATRVSHLSSSYNSQIAQTPTRAGYAFKGWYSAAEGGYKLCDGGGPIGPIPTHMTLFAQWVPAYTIHFDGNVVDDDAHPATVPGDMAAIRDEEVELPAATRFGYIFKGWATHPYGSTTNGNQVFAPGDKAVNLTDTPGDTVTLYALWALKYDADVPICAPADMTFALDATGTGEAKAVPVGYAGDFSPSDMEAMGSTHSAAIESRMAVPVEVESVSAAAAEGDGFSKVLSSTDGSAPEDQLSFTVASGDARTSVKAGQSQPLSGLLVPEASDATPVAKLALDYGLSLADTAVVLANDEAAAVPVAKVSYTLDVIDGMASKWGFFMLDGGTPVTPTRIKAAADDIAANYVQVDGKPSSTSDYYPAFEGYLRDDVRGYVAWGDGVTYEVRIIGINHDDRSDGTGKAGLTFEFAELLNNLYPMNTTNTVSGGWGRANLRGQMNPGKQSVVSGVDADSVWVNVPNQLQDIISPVNKVYSSSATAVSTSADSLFLASCIEHTGTHTSSGTYPSLLKEGKQYAYYAQFGTNDGGTNWAPLCHQFQCGDLLSSYWWTRSLLGTYWTRIYTGGGHSGGGSVPNGKFGVAPCFAI